MAHQETPVPTAIPAHVPGELVHVYDYRRPPGIKSGDPHAVLVEQAAGKPPIFWSPVDPGFWVLRRYEDMLYVLQHPAIFSSFPGAIPHKPGTERKLAPFEYDPPEHTAYRRAESVLFTPQAVHVMEPIIREQIVGLVDAVAGRGECDAMIDFAGQVPVLAFGELLGLGPQELGTFLQWAGDMNTKVVGSPEQVAATQQIVRFLNRIIAERREQPSDDLISQLWDRPIGDRAATADDIFDMALMLFLAGLDTTAKVLGFGLRHLATNPADRRRVVEDPASIPTVIEEFLRMFPPAHSIRTATEDVELDRVHIKAGDHVLISWTLANRDPELCPHADQARLDRESNRHYGFGAGPHRCLGLHLARSELSIAFEEWHRAIPDYRLREDVHVRSYSGETIGLRNLPLVWRT